MMETIAPVWDGNETWLVLGGGGLFAAFPFAYATLMPALYLPIILMLLALILRGVAFEVPPPRAGARKGVLDRRFRRRLAGRDPGPGTRAGRLHPGRETERSGLRRRALRLAYAHSLLVAVGLTAGYALLGAAWLVWRTEGELQARARRWSWMATGAVAALLALVSLATLFVHPRVAARWGFGDGALELATLLPLLPIPLVGLLGLALAIFGLRRGHHATPLLGAYVVFLSGFVGLAVGFFPHIVPYDMTFRQAANANNALGLMLVGVGILLPVILGYTIWVYWLFRGKVTAGASYH